LFYTYQGHCIVQIYRFKTHGYGVEATKNPQICHNIRMNSLQWGTPETDLFVMQQTQTLMGLSLYEAYARGLRSKQKAGQRVDISALHSDLPIMPYVPQADHNEILPFFVDIVNTNTGVAVPLTRHRCGIVDVFAATDSKPLDVVVMSVSYPFKRLQVEALAQFAVAMAGNGLSFVRHADPLERDYYA